MNASHLPKPIRQATGRAGAASAIAELQHRSHEAASLLKALANPHRLMLLCHLPGAECSVADLGQITGIAQPSLSQQLGVLRNERLVAARREGKSVLYRVTSPAMRALLRTLHRLYCAPGVAASH